MILREYLCKVLKL